MMPECGCPMCDECARDSLINSDKNECPDCGEANNSPDDLIPWRQLRDKVSYSTLYLEWKLLPVNCGCSICLILMQY